MVEVAGPSPDPGPTDTPSGSDTRGPSDHLSRIVRAIQGEIEVAMGSPDRVAALCAQLREELGATPATSESLQEILPLVGLLRAKGGAIIEPVFSLLEEVVRSTDDPRPLLHGLLGVRESTLIRRALDAALACADRGSLSGDGATFEILAERVEDEQSLLREPAALAKIGELLPRLTTLPGSPDEAALTIFRRAGPFPHRRLAARILDLGGQTVPATLASEMLGDEAHAFLAPYLAYTRATHVDVLHLAPQGAVPATVLDSFRRAEEISGEGLLREALAELGWSRANLGLEARRVIGLSVLGSIPFMLQPEEIPLIETLAGARLGNEFVVLAAHGGLPLPGPETGDAQGSVARYRNLNLTHAALLADILDIAPLDRSKVERLLDRMDSVVADFVALFTGQAEECSILPGLYQDLKTRILLEMEKEAGVEHLSPELTRLVQAFDDPHTAGEVRTLHGLKRYLHQRGLKLGFRLVEAGRATNRTVDLLLCGGSRILERVKAIQYVDFEPAPETAASGNGVPYAVAVVIDGFTRQLLHGHRTFPEVRVFCYGNEVHYYLAYGAHPAFLRIDYSPPLAGGMIDLEYYGVSKFELSLHPNPKLDAIRLLFRRLEYDALVETTRVHARYDKERALDLGDLCEKAEALFRLVPYLMDLDWTIGNLALGPESRKRVAEAWAETFALWGALPIRQLLTKDRQGILLSLEESPAGPKEITWSGEGPYRDRFAPAPPSAALAPLRNKLRELGLDLPPRIQEDASPLGQLRLERDLLRPLREAVVMGRLVPSPEGLGPAPGGLFEREHEAERFAAVLSSTEEMILSASLIARLIAPLERGLRFRTTGSLNGHEVQSAALVLRGARLGLYVLRDGGGIARLAFFAPGEALWRRRAEPDRPWSSSSSLDAAALSSLLRASGYLFAGTEPPVAGSAAESAAILAQFRGTGPRAARTSTTGERVAFGLRASPGRAVGPALFGTAGRRPAEFEGSVLVAPSVRPEDNTFLYHCAGVVSTGGGILSHAGLIATQFRKPALIVPGEWRTAADGTQTLLYRTIEYVQEEREAYGSRISVRSDIHEREHRMREGDLLVVDADEGALRVLGQERDALALHEGFRALDEAGAALAGVSDPAAILAARGRRLRARFLVERILARLDDAVLAAHAVEELMLGRPLDGGPGQFSERTRLLSVLLENPRAGAAARAGLLEIEAELRRRARASLEIASERIPTSGSLYEILSLRLDVLRRHRELGETAVSLQARETGAPPAIESGERPTVRNGGATPAPPRAVPLRALERAVRRRVEDLRGESARVVLAWLETPATASPDTPAILRHALRRLERIERVLGAAESRLVARARARLAREDQESLRAHEGLCVLGPADGGFALHPLIGWKAANLSEVDRLAVGAAVPPWFVVTDAAFQRLLDMPAPQIAVGAHEQTHGSPALRGVIDDLLRNEKLDGAQKSARIRDLWERVTLPEEISRVVLEAYRRLALGTDGANGAFFVAIRSSALEEDAELAARAGEFDTFLFVRGEDALLDHIKRAWSGLWTERAIHNREVIGRTAVGTGGGVIVQRIVHSRVAGVLQTVNTAEGDLREMVINAGLGLGEGIVSGAVAADHIVVFKEGESGMTPLRFRYATADKLEQVVYNERTGVGTARVESRYHQRLRPALEYVELCELVRTGARLEEAYGYPLDIEFGIEGSTLYVLQARPVAASMSVLTETLEHQPLPPGDAPGASEEKLS